MPFLIDGSNLGGALAGAAGARDRRLVVRRVLPWARWRGRVVMVFDGAKDSEIADHYGPLAIRCSGAEDADTVILRLVTHRSRDWQVVTGDAALAAACRERGARVVSPAGFLKLLEKVPDSSGRKDPGDAVDPVVDVAEWEELFRRGRGE